VLCALFLSVTVSGWAAVCGVWAGIGDRSGLLKVEMKKEKEKRGEKGRKPIFGRNPHFGRLFEDLKVRTRSDQRFPSDSKQQLILSQ
jgi:hypothetical protein